MKETIKGRPCSGVLDEKIDSNHFFMNDIMHCMNSNSRKVTSYKYAFFKCILDNLFNAYFKDGYYYLDFKYLRYSFSKIYWNLASKYKVPQIHNGRKSFMVEKFNVLKNISKYSLDNIDFDVLENDLKDKYLDATKNQIKKDVLFALYTDFNSHIYGYNLINDYIYFSKRSFQFLSNYKNALEKIDFYAWIKWTENILEIGHKNVSNLSQKLDEKPERVALERFKKDLLNLGDEFKCFYCNKNLLNGKAHLDHFIPWSFIKNNMIWNFVFSCENCNESKNDKLPNTNYLEKLIIRNKKIFGNDYREKNLKESYEAALNNGFCIWVKK